MYVKKDVIRLGDRCQQWRSAYACTRKIIGIYLCMCVCVRVCVWVYFVDTPFSVSDNQMMWRFSKSQVEVSLALNLSRVLSDFMKWKRFLVVHIFFLILWPSLVGARLSMSACRPSWSRCTSQKKYFHPFAQIMFHVYTFREEIYLLLTMCLQHMQGSHHAYVYVSCAFIWN